MCLAAECVVTFLVPGGYLDPLDTVVFTAPVHNGTMCVHMKMT